MENSRLDPRIVRAMLKGGALICVFGPGIIFSGCNDSSSSGAGVPASSGTASQPLQAHLEDKYDISYDPAHPNLVRRVEDKSSGGVLADRNVYVLVSDSAGGVQPIGNAVDAVSVKSGDQVLIGEVIRANDADPDELKRYQFVTGPFRTVVA